MFKLLEDLGNEVKILDSLDDSIEIISKSKYKILSDLIYFRQIPRYEDYLFDKMSGVFDYVLAITDETNIEELLLPDNCRIKVYNFSNYTDFSHLFEGATIELLDLSDFDTSKIIDMNYMFRHAEIEELILDNFDTSHVTDMTSMFQNCVTSKLDLRSFEVFNVVYMSNMFEGVKTDYIDLSSFNTLNLLELDSMFDHLVTKEIRGLNLNTSKVESMKYLFHECIIPKIDISSFDTRNVNSMFGMFSYFKTESLIGLERLNTKNVTNMGYMFKGVSLKTLNLSNFNVKKVQFAEGMFHACELELLDLSNFYWRDILNLWGLFSDSKIQKLILYRDDCIKTNYRLSNMFSGLMSDILDLRTLGGKTLERLLDSLVTNQLHIKPRIKEIIYTNNQKYELSQLIGRDKVYSILYEYKNLYNIKLTCIED